MTKVVVFTFEQRLKNEILQAIFELIAKVVVFNIEQKLEKEILMLFSN